MSTHPQNHILQSHLQISLDLLLVVAILNSQLRLPQHSTSKVGQIHSLDLVDSLVKGSSIDVALVTIGTTGQCTNVQLDAATDTLAPVLDGLGKSALGNVAVAVVVELDLDPVEELADVEGFRLVGVGALGCGGEVVFLGGVLGKVGFELFGHGEVACSVVGFVI